MKLLLIVIVAVSALSCKHKPAHKRKAAPITNHIKTNLKSVKTETDTVREEFPAEKLMSAIILTTDAFHNDEVPVHAQRMHWHGLFRNKHHRYYLAPTPIKVKQVVDEMMDNANQKTGWQVSTTNADTSILLIAGLNLNARKPVEKIALTNQGISIGEKSSFSYKGNLYTLYASGDKVTESPGSKFYTIRNYRLFLKAIINGKNYNDLLVAASTLDYPCSVWFAGDIDGDDMPDLILNTSSKENMEIPTLYLSKPANNGQLLKAVGKQVRIGC